MKIRSLRHLLAIRSAWIAVVPFLLSAMLGWFWLRPQMVADTEEHQRQLAAVIASQTEAYLVASSEAITRTALVLSKRLVSSYELQEYLDTMLASSMNLTSITFTDANGRITAIALPAGKSTLRQEMTGIDLSLTSAVRQVRTSGKPAWSDAYLSPVGGGLVVAYATPTAGGVALGEISLVQLSIFLKGIAAHGNQSIFIIDRRGQVIADQEGRYTARQYNLTNLEIVREGLGSGKPVTRSFTFDGERVVGSLTQAPILDWNILVASPVELAYRSALTTTGIFATALCMALLLAAGLSLLISHFLATRLENLVSHARMIESGEEAGEWPKTPVREFNLLGEALHSMANTLREREHGLNAQLIFMQQLLDSIPVPVYYKDADGLYLGCNAAFESFIGRQRSDIVGKQVYEVLPQERADKHHETDSALLSHPGVQMYEVSGMHCDGKSHDIIFNKATFVDADNRVAGIVGALIDITERKRAEEELRESEEKFRVLAETSPTAIFLFQGEMIIYANPATERLFGYSAEELLQMRFWDWAHEDFREMVRASGLARQRGEAVPGRYESRFVTKASEDRWLVVSAGLIEYHGRPAGVASFLDITESKRIEVQLRDSLAEKELLLKEVHHRVKNNLQVISTLLDLQADTIHDDVLQKSLKDCQDRIKAMALIHEKLYESSDLARIDFWEYIEGLVGHLLSSYVDDPQRIVMKVDVGDIQMGIDRAIPYGLIINELVSNAIKHAFPNGRSGEIAISLRADDGGGLTLTVADNGVGLPPGLDFRNTETLGLQLLNLLTKQLRGELSILNDGGAAFIIRFKN
jgi:PAS domain S-box-containing protein